jgi:Arc/MetJ-type ribon-helix-helix transcriptional regulator
MTIDLDKKTQHLIDHEIQAGRFGDAATLVSVAVRHLLVTRGELGYSRDQIDALIADAVASLERGEGIDGEEFFARLKREERQPQNQRNEPF